MPGLTYENIHRATTMKAIIRIALSQAGRREDVLAGGDGRPYYDLIVPRDFPDFRGVVLNADIDRDVALLDMRDTVRGERVPAWDWIPTVEQALSVYRGIVALVVQRDIAENDRRRELGLQAEEYDFELQDGFLLQVPVWEELQGSRNWLAVIHHDPTAPGGLTRNFMRRAGSLCPEGFYHIPFMLPGVAVEFGADFFGPHGKRIKTRWYGFVVRQDATRIIFRHTTTPMGAIAQGMAYRETVRPPAPPPEPQPEPQPISRRRRAKVDEERPEWEL